MNFSLVIPCFNEQGTVQKILETTKDIFIKNNIELIIVNNGSSDNTHKILKDIISNYTHVKYINLKNNLGYGGGILEGLKACTGEVIGWTHADLQTNPLDAILAFEKFKNNKKNYKLYVKGNRQNRPFFDKFFTFGMSIFETILLRRILYDVNAQPTIFPKDFYEKWVNPPTDFSLDLYSYYFAIKNKYKIDRIKVNFLKRIYGESKWNYNFFSRIRFISRTVNYSIKLRLKEVN
tara:strand:- start:192 stop:896 length:705 start_codon:yes stop_codon:yes gene_type:complete